jgi:membrane peptidoglycan carboxypeptidase
VSLVEPGTGKIKAMAQSRGYGKGKGKTYVNINVPRKYNGGIGFSPGSTFKPFVLAAAIRQGIPLSTSLPSPAHTVISQPVKNCPLGKPSYNTTPWSVSNSTSAGSTSTLLSGTARSVNTFFANLEARTGICEPASIATKLGATRSDGGRLQQVKPFVLGVNEIAPLSMAEAYATFAARGVHCNPLPVTQVLDRTGSPLPVRGADCHQVIPKDVADGVNYVLRKVVDGPDPGRTAQHMSMMNEGRQVAGKTGTAESRKAVWFMGYTSNLVGAAAIADAHPRLRSLIGDEIHGRVVRGDQVWGGTLAGPMWLASMHGALQGKKSPNMVEPNPRMVAGIPTQVPDVTGKWQREARPILQKAGFTMSVAGRIHSPLPEGQIAQQTPAANSQAGMGSVIIVYLSDGHPQPPPPPPNPGPGPNPKPTKNPLPPFPPNPIDGGGGGQGTG